MDEATGTVNFRRYAMMGLAVALLGGIALAAGFGSDKVVATQAYFYGWFFWAMITIGCLGLNFLHHTIRGAWGLSVIRLVEAGSSPLTLFVTALAYIPIFINRAAIYPWADHTKHLHILDRKAWYLNDNFFILRFVIYFVIWIALSHILRSSSQKQDETLDPQLGVKRQTIGPIGLVIFFVTMTFATTDWLMSIDAKWYSTLLPLLTAVGGALSALSLCIILILRHRNEEPYSSVITSPLTKDLGNMIFALTMLWGYMTLSQYLITYSGHLPEEIPYYINRNEHGWQILSGMIVLTQFFIPFTALLASRVKRFAKNLVAVVILVFVVRIFDMYWVVMPSMRGHEVGLLDSMKHWQDWAAILAFGGLWFALFGSQVHQAAILPKHDTRLLELEHAH